ncbi:flagellar basal body-associated protein FliL [alpha proteobacterium Q-1]|nr:flagellar basal body-associated protein FliL [alpha proteobacterium Q-1]
MIFLSWLAMIAIAWVALAPLPAWALSEKKGEAAAAAPIYVELTPMTVPLLRDGYVSGSFHLRLNLAATDAEAKTEINRLMPRLEAAYLANLSDLSEQFIRPGESVDLDIIKMILQSTTDRLLGQGVANLLIVETSVRR